MIDLRSNEIRPRCTGIHPIVGDVVRAAGQGCWEAARAGRTLARFTDGWPGADGGLRMGWSYPAEQWYAVPVQGGIA